MVLIKRYPNRKLYDTAAKQYITLRQVADLIYRGHEVQVVDHLSGEDLTAITLTQVVLELEKRSGSVPPPAALIAWLQAGSSAPLANPAVPDEHTLLQFWNQHNLPTRDDLQRLIQQVEDLTAKVEALTSAFPQNNA